jgi:hypothetical protein
MERGEGTCTGGVNNNCTAVDSNREKVIEAVKRVQEGLGEMDSLCCPVTYERIRSSKTTPAYYIAGWCIYKSGCECESKDCPIGLGKKEEPTNS